MDAPGSAIRPGEPYGAAETERLLAQLDAEGYVHLGPVLEADEVAALRDAMERKAADPRILADGAGDHIRGTTRPSAT